MTFAIGLCISFPGKSPPKAKGMSARADVSAVINMGFNRSSEPLKMVSCNELPSDEHRIIVRNQQHTVTRGDSEKRNKSDNSWYAYLSGRKTQDKHASDKCQRKIQQDDRRLRYASELIV